MDFSFPFFMRNTRVPCTNGQVLTSRVSHCKNLDIECKFFLHIPDSSNNKAEDITYFFPPRDFMVIQVIFVDI